MLSIAFNNYRSIWGDIVDTIIGVIVFMIS